MKPLLRVLWLLLGLIYRLIVLVMFERWIPFPERSPFDQPQPDAPRAQRKARGDARGQIATPRAQQRQLARRQLDLPDARAPRPIFEPRAVEPAPEYVAALESKQLALRAPLPAQRPTPPVRAGSGRSLRALLRDKRALAGAIVLGEALADRRSARR